MVDMTIGRSWGMGYFTDLVCIGRIFSQISLELEFFSPTYNGVRFCSALYVMSDIFSVQDIFLPGIYLHAFFLSKSVCRTFFLKSPITSQKSNGRPLKSTKHLVSWQILICQSFLKAFETIGDKILKWRGEEFVSTYPYPESPYGRTYA